MDANSPAVTAALKRFEGLYPETIELSLGRIRAVLEGLDRPHGRLPPVIHVAGTNGKGSTCAYLRAMVEAAGLSAHVFTSPHLVRFNERIRLAGHLIADDYLVDCLERTLAAVNGQPITHFEATTSAALLAFSEQPADFLILEVGLGGRFDATNVIDDCAMSVITPVDYDHKQFLGTDLAKIAWEKAGIIKRQRPVVSAIQSRVCADVIEAEAKRLGAPLVTLSLDDRALVSETVALAGPHQRLNAALAAKALKVLHDGKFEPSALMAGAQGAIWPARMQKLAKGPVTNPLNCPDIWLDGGHNPHAAKAIAEYLSSLGGRTVLVSAMMASKDHANFFWALESVAHSVHTLPNSPAHAGADPDDLAIVARDFIPHATAHMSLEAALQAADADEPDRILICGSLYLAGEVLMKNQEIPN